MPLRLALPLAAVLAAGLIAGCADRLYEQKLINPEGSSNQACLDRCARLRDECEARQTMREQECADRVAVAKADHGSCSGGGAGPCAAPESCLGADMRICQSQHEDCFTACGGQVERRLRERPWEAPTQPQTATPSP
jgi:hypothetical protein